MTRVSSDAECDALLPARIPAPVSVVMPSAEGPRPGTPVCDGAMSSDGTGAVAIASRGGQGWTEWQAFSADGHATRTFSSAPAANTPGTRNPMAQPRGWLVVNAGALFPPYAVSLAVVRPDGSIARTVPVESPSGETRIYGAYADPSGGALVVIAGPTTERATGCYGEARRFDALGTARSAPGDVPCRHTAGGISRTGDALVLGQALPDAELAGQTIVTWLDVAESIRARATGVEDAMVTMFPLLDGSVVAYVGDRIRVYPHLATSTTGAPEWLLERSPLDWQLRFTRGNRGYALFRRAARDAQPCDPPAELRAPSGRLCATLTFFDEHGACVAGRVDQGWDGTVIQNTAPCSYRWWPRLLAGP